MGDEVTEAQASQDTEVTTEEIIAAVEDTEEETTRVQPDGTESNDDDDEDPLEEYRKQWEATKLAELRAEAVEAERKEREERQAQEEAVRQANTRREQAKNRFAEATKKSAEAAKAIKVYDEDGNERTLSDNELQVLINPWNDFNRDVHVDKETEVYSNLADAIVANLPENTREEFAKRAANKPLPEYIKIFAELATPKDAIRKEVESTFEERLKAEYARGYAKAQKARVGTPPQGTERSVDLSREKPDLTNLVGAAQALQRGDITAEQYREIHKKIRG